MNGHAIDIPAVSSSASRLHSVVSVIVRKAARRDAEFVLTTTGQRGRNR
jgi:hypothetical protein